MAMETRVSPHLSEYTVVDTDVHLRIPTEKVAPYVDDPFRKRLELGQLPSDGWDRYKSGRIEKGTVHTAAQLREGLCEGYGVDHPVVNPSMPWLPRLSEPEYAAALARGYNDYFLDNVVDEDDDFYGIAQIPTQRVEDAVAEIDRIGDESGIVGLYVIPMGTPEPMGNPRYDPIWQAAEDHDLTIAFHPHGTISAMDFPKHNYGFNRYISVHTLGFVWGNMQMVVSLIEQGVPVKFPDLTFTFLEGDTSWVPGLMFRMNKEYAARRDELPLLEKNPEDYVREFYFASQPLGEPNDGRDMQHLLSALDAPNMMMFSSDYPHWDFDSPNELFKYLGTLEEADRKKILSGNAAEAFDLPV